MLIDLTKQEIELINIWYRTHECEIGMNDVDVELGKKLKKTYKEILTTKKQDDEVDYTSLQFDL